MPAVTRLGDNSVGGPCKDGKFHGASPSNAASSDVFCNDKGSVRVGDTYNKHPDDYHDGRNLSSGSPNVYVNDKQMGRISDPISCGDKVKDGSSDVFAND